METRIIIQLGHVQEVQTNINKNQETRRTTSATRNFHVLQWNCSQLGTVKETKPSREVQKGGKYHLT